MTVLVTGGGGFIGSHVVDRLLEAGHRVRVLDLAAGALAQPERVELVEGSLLDAASVQAAARGCEAIVHLAAMADADDVARRPADAERVNAGGTLNVLEAARAEDVGRVVYASTIWVYSDADRPAVDEETPLHPPGHLYTATKLAGELYCRAYSRLYDLDYTILRFGIPYGPRARPEAVVPTFVRKALSGEPLTIAGGGLQSRRFVYVEDLAAGVVDALGPSAANRVYNLVGGEDVTIRQVAEAVQASVGDVELVDVPGRQADFGGVEVSGERAELELGWRATTPFEDGVERYVAWHRDQAPAEVPAVAPRAALARRRARAAIALAAGAVLPVVLALSLALVAAAMLEVLQLAGASRADLNVHDLTRIPHMRLDLLVLCTFGAAIAASRLARGDDWRGRASDGTG